MRVRSLVVALVLMVGCAYDVDGDGSPSGEDCNDADADVYPGGVEICDAKDNDCNGTADDNPSDGVAYYDDIDRDGYGDPATEVLACAPAGAQVAEGGDCDDSWAAAHPGAAEYCNGADDDCDGETDEDDAVDALDWWVDADGDGFGAEGTTPEPACSQPSGYADADDDCNDGDSTVAPDADEYCDGVDNDCNGVLDDDYAVDATTWYEDADADGFGAADSSWTTCAQPDSYVGDATDCDDTSDLAHPGGTEVCDAYDNDCDPSTTDDGQVTLDGTATFASIQEALDAATAGSVVMVCDGTWTENLTTWTDVTIAGANGPESTTLQGDGTASVIVANGALELTGVTVTGGNSSFVGGGLDGYSGGTDIVVDDCIFEGNTASYGGGLIGSLGGTTAISNTEIQDNVAEASGGGLYLFEAELTNVRLLNNEATFGGGLMVDSYAVTLDDDCEIVSNAADYGGGVYLSGAELTGGDVSNNIAELYGGGVYAGTATMTETQVFENIAGESGGGVFLEGSSLLDTVESTSNDATTGGGVYAASGTSELQDCDVDDNTADSGAGLYIAGGELTAEDTDITGNVASTAGGGATLASGTLVSDTTDWGTSTVDNSPDDVFISSSDTAYTGYGAAESFTCTSETGACK